MTFIIPKPVPVAIKTEKLIELDINKQMSQFVMELDEKGQVMSYKKDQKSEDIRRTLAKQ